jgi:hypothetical protein
LLSRVKKALRQPGAAADFADTEKRERKQVRAHRFTFDQDYKLIAMSYSFILTPAYVASK